MKLRERGSTSLEAVMVIALTGIAGTMVAVFMRQPVDAYVDLALGRITRELQRALPNRVRVDASGSYPELLPVSAGGRYRAAAQADGSGDFLDFNSATDNTFEVLGPASPWRPVTSWWSSTSAARAATPMPAARGARSPAPARR